MAVTIDKMPEYETVVDALRAAAALYGNGNCKQITFVVGLEEYPLLEDAIRRAGGKDKFLMRILTCLCMEAK